MTIFDHFCQIQIFQKKNKALSRTSLYGPLTQYKVSEKTNNPIPRKLPEKRTDERKDGKKKGCTQGQTLIHRTLSAMARGPKNVKRYPNEENASKIFIAGVFPRTIDMVQKDYQTSILPRKKFPLSLEIPLKPHHLLRRYKPWHYDTHKSNIQEQS